MGAATVRTYVAAGAHVVAMDLSDDDGRAVVEQANDGGPGRATYRHVDVADRASVDEAFREAVAELGGLDVLAHPGDPDRDLGPVMVFFASDASRFITGQLIPVDGGQTSVR